jgi:pimeloyl-ACP methyl ester carboxylesterase
MTPESAAPVPESGEVAGVCFAVAGEGLPVTVFAHGLGGSSAETRPLATRVPGTRVLLTFRGHGESADLPADGWDYDVLAADLLAVSDHVGATQAVGLSLGGGALLRVLSRDPKRFDRLAFVMPAAIDAARVDGAALRLRSLAVAVDAGDVETAAEHLLAELPDEVRGRRGVRVLVTRRAAQLCSRTAPRPSGDDRPLHDRSVLAEVKVPTLVIGQADDPLHQLDVARELAELLPDGHLLELPQGGVFWNDPRRAQDALALHLSGETT